MRIIFTQIIAVVMLCTAFSVPSATAYAEEVYTTNFVLTTATFRWNNENWFTMPHPKPVSFTIYDDGSASGLTETGVAFTQYNIENELNIRIQRFEMEDHYHYIVAGKDVYTFTELSAELAKAYTEQTALNS